MPIRLAVRLEFCEVVNERRMDYGIGSGRSALEALKIIQRAAMDLAKPIDDPLVIGTLRKGVKNLADAKVELERGGRVDLVAANEAEIRLLEKYLPKGIDGVRLDALIAEAIQESGAQSRKEMGKVLGLLKQRPEAPLIDFAAASKLVQAKLP